MKHGHAVCPHEPVGIGPYLVGDSSGAYQKPGSDDPTPEERLSEIGGGYLELKQFVGR